MKLPFGRRGLIALGVVFGAAALWKVRAQRREREAREWEEEIAGAIDEGRIAAESAASSSG
jgi:hypothetical protein